MSETHYLQDKTIAVTGCCGTVGAVLVQQLIKELSVPSLVGLDNNESELFFQELKYPGNNYQFILADVRDTRKLLQCLQGVDIVFHTAAFKHVILCERSPFEAVQTNILGVKNIIDAATGANVKRVIFTSSDKAVNPTNVMGTSKLMGERLMSAANSNARQGGPIFASTRFGNVLGSRGSVIHVFHEQIKTGGPVTLTDPKMTRFIMSIDEAVRLVIDSVHLIRGGEVFVTKMPVLSIKDLAEVMIALLAPEYGHAPEDIRIKEVGSKPGEKMYEELINEEEVRRTIELEQYFAVIPAFRGIHRHVDYTYEGLISESIASPYNSARLKPMQQDEIRNFLLTHDLLRESIRHPDYKV